MRVKTEERRQAILDAAASVFRDVGYERATMGEISARLGGSKTTLYSYFASKEELFVAVMTHAVEAQAQRIFATMTQDDEDVEAALRRFGRAYVEVIVSPEFLAFRRVGVAEAVNSGIGHIIYDIGPKEAATRLSEHLHAHMSAGRLRQADPWLAALHLIALLEAGIIDPLLHGVPIIVDREEALEMAIQAFLRGYGPQQLELWPR
jgi:AcrR family transcriptional regulator